MGHLHRFYLEGLEVIGKFEDKQKKLATGLYQEVRNSQTGETELQRIPKEQRPFCGAKTRNGESCKSRAVFGMARCRMHGGMSTGPKTEEGRARIAESNSRRVKKKCQDS